MSDRTASCLIVFFFALLLVGIICLGIVEKMGRYIP